MEVMEEMVGVKRESVTCLVVRLELERSISVFTSFLEVSTINMAVITERKTKANILVCNPFLRKKTFDCEFELIIFLINE